jgi:hypothetical protein
VDLEPFEKLPVSHEVAAEEAALAAQRAPLLPEHERLPITYLGRGRGALVLVAVLGLASFLLPWVHLETPYEATFSGLKLAGRGAGWLWGGLVAWFVMIPLVLSRRTIAQMRGVRGIVTVFAAMSFLEVVALVSFPPKGHPRVPVEWAWGFGVWISAVISVVGTAVAVRFGGALPELPKPTEPPHAEDTPAEAATGVQRGVKRAHRTLH